jgi:hypothetical protein
VALRKLLLALSLAAPLACGDPEVGGRRASVTFVYEAPVAVLPGVAQDFPECVAGVGQTHIHPSWRGFDRLDLTPQVDRWTRTFDDVPVDARQRIRVSDPNACALNATGASTANVFANGVLLTEIVDTPGTGTEPGLAFTVSASGAVTP